jgi:hypothetical protein
VSGDIPMLVSCDACVRWGPISVTGSSRIEKQALS